MEQICFEIVTKLVAEDPLRVNASFIFLPATHRQVKHSSKLEVDLKEMNYWNWVLYMSLNFPALYLSLFLDYVLTSP